MKKRDGQYLISETAEFFGISTDTLRLYDKKHILKPRVDTNTGYRRYRWNDMVIFTSILNLKSVDCSLDDIYSIINECSDSEALSRLNEQMQKLDTQMDRIVTMKKVLNSYLNILSKPDHDHEGMEIYDDINLVMCAIDGDMLRNINEFRHIDYSSIPLFTFSMDFSAEMLKENTIEDYKRIYQDNSCSCIAMEVDEKLKDSILVRHNDRIEFMGGKVAVQRAKVPLGEEIYYLNRFFKLVKEKGLKPYGKFVSRVIKVIANDDSPSTTYEFIQQIR